MTTTTRSSPSPVLLDAPPDPIPFRRVVTAELRKAFDTRSGLWLLVAVAATAALASAGVVLWAPERFLTFETFATAVGVPMSFLLPVIAILSVTSEWSQRTGLTTFTLVPRRSRTIAAKAVAMLGVAIVSMVVAMGIGALGTLVGSTLRGVEPTWDTSPVMLATTVLAQVLSVAVGFVLGLVMRQSAAALVGYFVFAFVLPPISQLLAATQGWFADAQGWVDFTFTQTKLYDTDLSGREWWQLASVVTVWLVVPAAVGLWRLRRAEVA